MLIHTSLWCCWSFLKTFYFFINFSACCIFVATLAFSSCEQGPLFVAGCAGFPLRWPLVVESRLSRVAADLVAPWHTGSSQNRVEAVTPAWAGRFSTTAQGKPMLLVLSWVWWARLAVTAILPRSLSISVLGVSLCPRSPGVRARWFCLLQVLSQFSYPAADQVISSKTCSPASASWTWALLIRFSTLLLISVAQEGLLLLFFLCFSPFYWEKIDI